MVNMLSGMQEKPKMAIVGGGISGLVQALEAEKAGYQVTVFEETNRFGGKIENAALDGKIINAGAEFIDTDQKSIIALANMLGVKLIEATDQKTETFLIADGNKLSSEEFHKAYKPLAEMIIKDQKLLKENPEFAKHINQKSLPEYLNDLAEIYKNEHGKEIDHNIIKTVEGAFASEVGVDPKKISALQFVNEASPELGSLLASDAGLRVEGGTAALIDKLKEHLTEKGIKFQTGAKLEELKKDADGKFNLGFTEEKFDRVGLALPAYALGQVKGLEALGMSPEERGLLQDIQYTHSAKVFVKVKEGVDIDNAALFTANNWQAWTHDKGIVTFLVGGEELNNKGKDEVVKIITEQYAKAYGKNPEDIFEKDEHGQLKIFFGAPDTKRPCYASPKAGQLLSMEALHGTMERMAENGVALAGTYFPKDGSVGFMELGVESAQKSIGLVSSSLLKTLSKAAEAAGQQVADIGSSINSWVGRVTGNNPTHPIPIVQNRNGRDGFGRG